MPAGSHLRPMTTPRELLADRLADARRSNVQIPSLPAELVPQSADEAYAINAMIAERLGWEPLGWKIAGTTTAVREKLRLDTPIYGRTYRRFATTSPVRFEAGDLLDPLIECEFFVTLARSLPPRGDAWTMAEVVDAIETVHIGVEVAECRYPSTALPSLPAILADGSASGRYVFGDIVQRWRDGLAGIDVRVEVDGKFRRGGTGADVMGDPLQPLCWLANERRRWGDGLNAGETISTGSMTGMLPIRGGQSARAIFGSFAPIEITIDH